MPPAAPDLIDRLRAAVRARLPAACALSGGLDSSGLLTLATEAGPAPRAYTLVLDEDDAELARARRLAARLGARHVEIRIVAGALPAAFPAAVRAAGQPLFGGLAAANYLFFQQIREMGESALLSGAGADELFAGHPDTLEVVLPIEADLATAAGLEPRLAYLDGEVAAFAARLAPDDLVDKRFLREAFRGLLPDEIRLAAKVPRRVAVAWDDLFDEWLPPDVRRDPAAEPQLLRLVSIAVLKEA